jgi:hypothetical protein
MSLVARATTVVALLGAFTASLCVHTAPRIAFADGIPECETVHVFVGPSQPYITVCRPVA